MGGSMGVLVRPRRTRRAALLAVAMLVVIALVTAMASVAGAKLSHGPFVAAAGVGTKEALSSANCGPDGKLAYPYQQRAPCTRPLKSGQSNGGATSMGVTAKTIKVVLFIGTHAQQQQTWTALGQSPPKDHATGQNGYVEDAYHDWDQVLAHSYNTYGRKFEYVVAALHRPWDEPRGKVLLAS